MILFSVRPSYLKGKAVFFVHIMTLLMVSWVEGYNGRGISFSWKNITDLIFFLGAVD